MKPVYRKPRMSKRRIKKLERKLQDTDLDCYIGPAEEYQFRFWISEYLKLVNGHETL